MKSATHDLQAKYGRSTRASAMKLRFTRLIRALSVAERELRDFTMDHPGICDCRVCDAWHSIFRAKRDLSRPGSEIHDFVSAASTPLLGTDGRTIPSSSAGNVRRASGGSTAEDSR